MKPNKGQTKNELAIKWFYMSHIFVCLFNAKFLELLAFNHFIVKHIMFKYVMINE